eukprot:3941590-Rhodomonas_salina.3
MSGTDAACCATAGDLLIADASHSLRIFSRRDNVLSTGASTPLTPPCRHARDRRAQESQGAARWAVRTGASDTGSGLRACYAMSGTDLR